MWVSCVGAKRKKTALLPTWRDLPSMARKLTHSMLPTWDCSTSSEQALGRHMPVFWGGGLRGLGEGRGGVREARVLFELLGVIIGPGLVEM